MKMKCFSLKLLSVIACLSLLVGAAISLQLGVFAANTDLSIQFTADKTTVKPGDTVTVTAAFKDFDKATDGISGANFIIELDSISQIVQNAASDITIIDPAADSDLDCKDVTTTYDLDSKTITALYFAPSPSAKIPQTAKKFMKFSFKVKNDASVLNTNFSLVSSSPFFTFADAQTVTDVAINSNTLIFNVKKSITGIAVKKAPTKVQYVKGQALDLDGGELTVNYDWGTPETIDMTANGVTVEGYNAATLGEQTVTVKYDGKSATFKVTVVDKVVNSIAITTQPTKLAYIEGNTFDPAGMVVTATYNDNSTSPITGYTLSNTGKLAIGEKIKITFGGKEVTVTQMTVVAKTLLSIEVTTPPTRTKYMMGTELTAVDKTGMEITLTYDNGDKPKVTDVSKMSLTAGSLAAAGTATVTVTCEGQTATFELTVLDDANVKQAEQDIDEFLVDYQDVEELTDEQATEIMGFYNALLSRELDEVEFEAINNMDSMKELFTLYHAALELLMPAYNESYLDDTVTVDVEVGVMNRGNTIDVKNGSVSAANLATLREKYGDLTSVLKAIDMTYDAGGEEGPMLSNVLVGIKLDNITDVVIGYFDSDGVWQEIELDEFEDGFAYFYTQEGIGSYAVLKKASSTPTTTTTAGATTTAPDIENTQTGGGSAPLVACILVLMASAAAVILTKRNAFLQK